MGIFIKKYNEFKIVEREVIFNENCKLENTYDYFNRTYLIKRKMRFLFFTYWGLMKFNGIPYTFNYAGRAKEFIESLKENGYVTINEKEFNEKESDYVIYGVSYKVKNNEV